MKTLPFVLVFALAGVVSAQETYEISATAGQVLRVDRARVVTNARSCVRVGLPTTCTQTDVNALAPENPPTIYPESLAGRTAFLRAQLVQDIKGMGDAVEAYETSTFCTWFAETASQAEKDATCADAGLVAGCNVCRNR